MTPHRQTLQGEVTAPVLRRSILYGLPVLGSSHVLRFMMEGIALKPWASAARTEVDNLFVVIHIDLRSANT